MKRKVIQIGNRTKVLTLPSAYTKRWKISKGDLLNVVMEGDQLKISSAHVHHRHSITIPMQRATLSYLQHLYTCGFDEIHILGNPNLEQLSAAPYEVQEISPKKVCMRVLSQVERGSIFTQLRKIYYFHKHFSPHVTILRKHIQNMLRMVTKYGVGNQAKNYLFHTFLMDLHKDPSPRNFSQIPALLRQCAEEENP